MQKEIKINTKDNHVIYGTLDTTRKKSNTLIIFVHGLTGHQNEHQFYNAAKYFTKKGFNTFRFDLYSGEKKARNLSQITIRIHAKDLDTVTEHFKRKYQKVFVVGHSLGGPTILLSHTNNFNSIVLWDPSDFQGIKSALDMKFSKKLNAYILNWGTEYIIGKKMFNEWNNFPDIGLLISKVNVPIKFIYAGKSPLAKRGMKYYLCANKPRGIATIRNAHHTFVEEGVEEKLFNETLKWVKKYG